MRELNNKIRKKQPNKALDSHTASIVSTNAPTARIIFSIIVKSKIMIVF